MLYHITRDQWERIPEAYKAESALTQPGRKCCFVCDLTKAFFCAGGATTLYFEGLHFKVTDPEERPELGEREERRGKWAIDSLESETAKAFYAPGKVKVYEYKNPNSKDRLFRSTLYAYQWRDEYADDLTERELSGRLEELALYEELEEKNELPMQITNRPGSFIF